MPPLPARMLARVVGEDARRSAFIGAWGLLAVGALLLLLIVMGASFGGGPLPALVLACGIVSWVATRRLAATASRLPACVLLLAAAYVEIMATRVALDVLAAPQVRHVYDDVTRTCTYCGTFPLGRWLVGSIPSVLMLLAGISRLGGRS